MALGVIVANLIVDLLYGYLDPRITYQKRALSQTQKIEFVNVFFLKFYSFAS